MVIHALKIMLFTAVFMLASANQASDNPDAVWIDVRSTVEYQLGHLEGAVHIPYKEVVVGVAELKIRKDQKIYLYCQSGGRAGQAQLALTAAGYTQVVNVGSLDAARQLASTNHSQLP